MTEDLLIQTLSQQGYPVRLQGSLLPDDPYPDSFFTFWEHSSDSDSFYDNRDNAIIEVYDVNFYSIDPEEVYSVLRSAIADLKQEGFIVSGDGRSMPSDEPTHDGRGITVKYRKKVDYGQGS